MHATEYHFAKNDSKCHCWKGAGGNKAGWLNWNYCSATLLAEPLWSFWVRRRKGGSAWITSNLWDRCTQTTGPILFSLFKLVFLSVASIYWQTNGYNQASCSKRAAITVVSKQVGNHQSSAVYLICMSWSLATLEPPSFKGPLAPWLSDSHLLFQS